MISNRMQSTGVSEAAGNWRTLRVDDITTPAFLAESAQHAIHQAKRRTAAAPVASVNRGLI